MSNLKTRQQIDAEIEEILPDYPEPSRLPYVIEGMLPAAQVHLLAGPSGSGKTTLAFQMLSALSKGEPFLGRQTRQVKLAYVSGDRAAASVQETQDRCGVSFPVFSLVDENLVGEDLVKKVIPRLPKLYGYVPDFLYVDGFTALVPGGFLNNYSIVAKWLAGLQRYCWRMGITTLGACHTTKTKIGEHFDNPRQRIAGSVAWAGFSESVLIIEPIADDKTKLKRMVHVLPRNHPGEEIVLKFNPEGKLALPDKITHQESIASFIVGGLLDNLKVGDQVIYAGLRDSALEKGVQTRTFNRWLAKHVEDGFLTRVKKGVYVVSGSPQSPEEATDDQQAQTIQ